jgi:hypothetical protein
LTDNGLAKGAVDDPICINLRIRKGTGMSDTSGDYLVLKQARNFLSCRTEEDLIPAAISHIQDIFRVKTDGLTTIANSHLQRKRFEKLFTPNYFVPNSNSLIELKAHHDSLKPNGGNKRRDGIWAGKAPTVDDVRDSNHHMAYLVRTYGPSTENCKGLPFWVKEKNATTPIPDPTIETDGYFYPVCNNFTVWSLRNKTTRRDKVGNKKREVESVIYPHLGVSNSRSPPLIENGYQLANFTVRNKELFRSFLLLEQQSIETATAGVAADTTVTTKVSTIGAVTTTTTTTTSNTTQVANTSVTATGKKRKRLNEVVSKSKDDGSSSALGS